MTSLGRPIPEHACWVRHPGLTSEQHDLLASIRAQAMIFPDLKYHDACEVASLNFKRAAEMMYVKTFFSDLQVPTHKLHQLFPVGNNPWAVQCQQIPIALTSKTERFINSLSQICCLTAMCHKGVLCLVYTCM